MFFVCIGRDAILIEPLNDYTFKKFEQIRRDYQGEGDDSVLWHYVSKLILLNDRIQREGLKSKKRIIKLQSLEEDKPSIVAKKAHIHHSSPIICLSGGLKYQYLFDPVTKKHYERHAEAWSVRGHYRRYKSGKEVFIKPYTKGSGKCSSPNYRLVGVENE
jgi:hypothetical protein